MVLSKHYFAYLIQVENVTLKSFQLWLPFAFLIEPTFLRKMSTFSTNFFRDCELKEMTCLMTIAQTKNNFSAFKFFHKHYWNSGSVRLIAAVRNKNLKKLKLWKSITSLCVLRKNNNSGTKVASEGCFQKKANPELKCKDR